MLQKSTKKDWTKYWQSTNHQPEVIHEELLSELLKATSVKGKKILEVGAGMAGDSIYLAKKGGRITVLDFSEEALKQVRENARNAGVELETILADAVKIPFEEESFDIVFHQGFLEHFADPRLYLLEQKRVLKKGGLIVVDVPQRFTTYTLKKHWQMRQGEWFAGWETEFSIDQLEKLMKSIGFEVLSSYGWGYYGKLYQIKNLKLGEWYESLWRRIESSRLKLYLNFSIGVIAKKI